MRHTLHLHTPYPRSSAFSREFVLALPHLSPVRALLGIHRRLVGTLRRFPCVMMLLVGVVQSGSDRRVALRLVARNRFACPGLLLSLHRRELQLVLAPLPF